MYLDDAIYTLQRGTPLATIHIKQKKIILMSLCQTMVEIAIFCTNYASLQEARGFYIPDCNIINLLEDEWFFILNIQLSIIRVKYTSRFHMEAKTFTSEKGLLTMKYKKNNYKRYTDVP